ncbi:hypothetical protein K9N68_14640 [Kovacikia minuta CCNUW1]|uniref:hypothetical protein n=1 Tax=Kovacikia minuta TaxID=2931930 RepID=UPI001CD02F15|nr:hypothetical protein [Kovacikia minuta]UBF28962.1 hypothetical protein K9N68_14640 [Kovacikia minuta CCNUW1]
MGNARIAQLEWQQQDDSGKGQKQTQIPAMGLPLPPALQVNLPKKLAFLPCLEA